MVFEKASLARLHKRSVRSTSAMGYSWSLRAMSLMIVVVNLLLSNHGSFVKAQPLNPLDVTALIALRSALSGNTYITNSWIGPPDNNACNGWVGITCNYTSTLRRVVQIQLSTASLVGSLPTEIGLMDALEYLSFYVNRLTGTLPTQLGMMTSVHTILLFNNQFSGPIPPQLIGMTSLKSLWLQNNLLTGAIPPTLGQITLLDALALNNNSLTGPIPPMLEQSTRLRWLLLQDNQLVGGVPPGIQFIPQLTLSNCNFTGNFLGSCGDVSRCSCSTVPTPAPPTPPPTTAAPTPTPVAPSPTSVPTTPAPTTSTSASTVPSPAGPTPFPTPATGSNPETSDSTDTSAGSNANAADSPDASSSTIIYIVVPLIAACIICLIIAIIIVSVRRRRQRTSQENNGAELKLSSNANAATSQYSSIASIQAAALPNNYASSTEAKKKAGSQYGAIVQLNVAKTDPLFKYLVSSSEVQLGKELGRGAYGVVCEATFRNQRVACKALSDEWAASVNIDSFRQEALTMAELPPHANVVKLLGFTRDIKICILLEFIDGGSLDSCLRDPATSLSARQALQMMIEILAGLNHLHTHNVIHRDLAARNVLLRRLTMQCVLSDFGYSRKVDNGQEAQTKTMTGPLRWMAPEQFNSYVYSRQSDVWAFGVTAIEIFTRDSPYPGMDSMTVALKVASHQLRPSFSANPACPPQIAVVLDHCFEFQPEQRWSVQQLTDALKKVQETG